jgi:hypothetical protein
VTWDLKLWTSETDQTRKATKEREREREREREGERQVEREEIQMKADKGER